MNIKETLCKALNDAWNDVISGTISQALGNMDSDAASFVKSGLLSAKAVLQSPKGNQEALKDAIPNNFYLEDENESGESAEIVIEKPKRKWIYF